MERKTEMMAPMRKGADAETDKRVIELGVCWKWIPREAITSIGWLSTPDHPRAGRAGKAGGRRGGRLFVPGATCKRGGAAAAAVEPLDWPLAHGWMERLQPKHLLTSPYGLVGEWEQDVPLSLLFTLVPLRAWAAVGMHHSMGDGIRPALADGPGSRHP